jgi:hypothetical protein
LEVFLKNRIRNMYRITWISLGVVPEGETTLVAAVAIQPSLIERVKEVQLIRYGIPSQKDQLCVPSNEELKMEVHGGRSITL